MTFFKKNIARSLMISVALLPAAVYADTTARHTIEVTGATNGQTTSSATLTVDASANEREISGSVKTANGSAEFSFDGRTLTFADGYGIESNIVRNTTSEFVVTLTAFGPGHREHADRAIASDDREIGPRLHEDSVGVTIAYNKTTNSAAGADIGPISRFLAASTQYSIASKTIPVLVGELAIRGGLQRNSALGCIGAAILYVAAAIALVAGCGVPEPLEPAACAAALVGFVGAGVVLVDACTS